MLLLEEQINGVVNDIVAKRQELDKLLDLDCKVTKDIARPDVLYKELWVLERDVDRARRWLSSCVVAV